MVKVRIFGHMDFRWRDFAFFELRELHGVKVNVSSVGTGIFEVDLIVNLDSRFYRLLRTSNLTISKRGAFRSILYQFFLLC